MDIVPILLVMYTVAIYGGLTFGSAEKASIYRVRFSIPYVMVIPFIVIYLQLLAVRVSDDPWLYRLKEVVLILIFFRFAEGLTVFMVVMKETRSRERYKI